MYLRVRVLVCVVVAAMAPALSGCGDQTPTQAQTPPGTSDHTFPISTAKRYSGRIHALLQPPVITLGDPGKIKIDSGPVDRASVSLSNTTEGGRTAHSENSLFAAASWRLPEEARLAFLPLAKRSCTRNDGMCDSTQLFVTLQVHVDAFGNDLAGGTTTVLSCTNPTIDLRDGSGDLASVGDLALPESLRPQLEAAFMQPPAAAWLEGFNPRNYPVPASAWEDPDGGFTFSSTDLSAADPFTSLSCTRLNEGYEVAGPGDTNQTGAQLAAAPGQPCHR